jgi:hypothetical protein
MLVKKDDNLLITKSDNSRLKADENLQRKLIPFAVNMKEIAKASERKQLLINKEESKDEEEKEYKGRTTSVSPHIVLSSSSEGREIQMEKFIKDKFTKISEYDDLDPSFYEGSLK